MPHDGPGEHYHDLGGRVGGHADTVVWHTVGLDIGSTTAQAIFSKITLARDDAYYVVVERTLLHQSEVFLTPYVTPELMDGVRLASFVDREFAAASLSRDEIDTGAVIMTGLALSTHNARTIAEVLADTAGRFVAVSAGDVLEARLAANGAGLPEISANTAGLVLHVDIGGGTTKLSTWQAGQLQRLAAINVGARLITLDESRTIERLEPSLLRLAGDLALDLAPGGTLSIEAEDALTRFLAEQILHYGGILAGHPGAQAMLRTAPLYPKDGQLHIDAVVFSGGVSEYIYQREVRGFGDLGRALGRAVRLAIEASCVPLIQSSRGIRATVLGASQHSVQLSGNTIYVSDAGRLPLKNCPVVLVPVDLSATILDATSIFLALGEALRFRVTTESGSGGFVIALRWQGSPTYQRLKVVADAIAVAVDARLSDAAPCAVIVQGDVAGLLGALLDQCFAGRRCVICLDGVHVHEFDHVDIGALNPRSQALPVVVKSLLFAAPHIGETDARH